MYGVKWDVCKKWFLVIRVDERNGLSGNCISQILGFNQRRCVSHDGAVERLRRFGWEKRMRASKKTIKLIKATSLRVKLRLCA